MIRYPFLRRELIPSLILVCTSLCILRFSGDNLGLMKARLGYQIFT